MQEKMTNLTAVVTLSHYADCMYSWGSILGKKQGNQVIGPSNSVFTIQGRQPLGQ